jgi:hypothetical protein
VACGDWRTLLIFSCPTCTFTATSTLRFSLPYTCQSLYLEALAVDALGVVNSVAFPTGKSAATPTALLSTLSWTMEVLGTILLDTVRGETMQGYQLSTAAAEATLSPLVASLSPSRAHVTVSLALPLQTYYSSTLLTPRQSLVELFSSIVGLLGIIGLFRFLFLMSEVTLAQAALVAASAKRRHSAAPLRSAAAGGEGQVQQPVFGAVTNPIRRGAGAGASEAALVAALEGTPPPAAPAGSSAAGTSTGTSTRSAPLQWRVHKDSSDTWYVSLDGQTTVWELPEGGEVVEEAVHAHN